MSKDKQESEETLAEVMDARPLVFYAAGEQFSIRQPTTEEYDDALGIQNLVLRRTLAMPEVRALADQPCSAAEALTYKAMIAAAEKRFEELEDGFAKDAAAAEVSRLERALERRTLADEIAGDRAVLARDRWLTMRLLCDKDGKPVFDTNAADVKARWEALPLSVKEAARPAIWQALALVRSAPFAWDKLRGPK